MALTLNKIKKLLYKNIRLELFLKITSTLIAMLILYTLYKRGVLAIAFINGEPVSMIEVANIVSDNGGYKNAVDKLIAQKVIEYEAKKRNIIVKKEEIDQEILAMEIKAIENGRTLAELLKENDQTLGDLEKNVKLRITVYKILSQNIEVSEVEIDNFIYENNELYKDSEREKIREEVKKLLISNKINEIYPNWIKTVSAKTDIEYFIKF